MGSAARAMKAWSFPSSSGRVTATVLHAALHGAATLLALSALVFALFQILPGDPAAAILGLSGDPETYAQLRTNLGLDRPLPVQYGLFLKRALTGDFGRSYAGGFDVTAALLEKSRVTLALVLGALALAVAGGVAFACTVTLAGRGRWPAALDLAVAQALAVPPFVWAILMALGFAHGLGWFPAVFDGSFRSWVLPLGSLAWLPFLWLSRLLGREMARLMETGFAKFYRACGVPEARIVCVHALENAATLGVSAVSNVALWLVVGTFFVEWVFSVPGIGQLTVNSLLRYDLPVLQGVTLVIGAALVVVESVAEALQRLLGFEGAAR